ncbi:hypothetical protein DSO57_1003747 [Entomophthora muscae]|uniref:Uncharacterized protein n=1 Tax=Entomophthora muscae TaxID=34485 RepID=A0ACC2SXT2_9FUNG|nr:hypothetical protein DSO57_1003747 [Entomophthora muscae]
MGQHSWYQLVGAQSQKNTGGRSCGLQVQRPKGIQGQGSILLLGPGFQRGRIINPDIPFKSGGLPETRKSVSSPFVTAPKSLF